MPHNLPKPPALGRMDIKTQEKSCRVVGQKDPLLCIRRDDPSLIEVSTVSNSALSLLVCASKSDSESAIVFNDTAKVAICPEYCPKTRR